MNWSQFRAFIYQKFTNNANRQIRGGDVQQAMIELSDQIESLPMWKPVFGIANGPNNSVVMQLVNWLDGPNNPPPTGQYLGANGLTADINQAVNVRGIQGLQGWSPVFANVVDGLRIVQQVVDWTGTTGVKPPVTPALYVSANGYTNNIAQAIDIRGGLGINWRTDNDGNWQANTDYAANDGVYYGGNSYRRLTAGTSGSTFTGANWKLVAQGGGPSNGSVTKDSLDGALAKLTTLLQAIYPYGYENAPYAYAKTDQDGRIAYFVDLAGKLGTPDVPDLSGSIQAVTATANGLTATVNGLSQTVTKLDSRAYEWPDESGYVWSKVDQNTRVAIGINMAGDFLIKGYDVLAIAQAALIVANQANSLAFLSPYFSEFPNESGYLRAWTDVDGRVALGITTSGDMMVQGVNITTLVSGNLQTQIDTINGKIVTLANYITALYNLICVGDSLTAGAGGTSYPTQLAAKYTDGRTVTNLGVGGDTSTQIAFRFGAIACLLSVSGNQIPASGSVAVTPVNANILQNTRSKIGSLATIPGTLARDSSGNYTFTRTNAGTAKDVEAQLNFVPSLQGYDFSTVIIKAGRNNYFEPNTVLADIAAMVACLKPINKRFVIMPVLNGDYGGESVGGSAYNTIMSINNTLRDRYPGNFFDVRALLIRNYNPSIPQDVTDHANDVVPSSLRADNIHLNTAGYGIEAQGVFEFLQAKGW